jgi:arylsulfatase A-like enzyme
VIESNRRRWSGDRGSLDDETRAGLLVSTFRPTSDATRIIDIAPTVLKFFGLPIPPDLDGKPLF